MPRRQRARFVGELQRARGGRVPNGAGHVPAGEPEPPELVVWYELLDQRKELSLLKPDVCVKQFPRRLEPSRSIAVYGSTAQPHCLHEPIVMVARERDQGGVALHSTTLGYGVVPAVLGKLHSSSTRLRHRPP